MLLKKEINAIPQYNNLSLPLGIEYERLNRDLHNRINQKYHIIDYRYKKDINNKPLSPGVYNGINNQSAITFEEPNTKPAYPIQDIPYSQGLVWE